MSNKKLVFVHDGPVYYDNDGNYYEFAYHKLYERYSYLADEIYFLIRTRGISGDNKFTIMPKQIKVISVPNFKSPKLYLKEKKNAEVIIQQTISNMDYVILRTQSSIAQIALKYIKKYNKPYIIESVGCSWDSYWNHNWIGKIIAPYMFYKTKKAIKNAPYVYYVTNEFLQKRYPTTGKSVSCSNVVIEKCEEGVLNGRIDKIKNNSLKNKIVLGTAAALDTRYKGQEYVIKAINKLVKKGYNVEYRLAGGNAGDKKNTFLYDLAIKENVLDRVKFMGSLSLDKMNNFYDDIDIYIQPSKQEGLPRAVIEAMSRGCVVIGSDIAGIPELIQGDCLFKKGNVNSLITTLERVLKMNMEKLAKENFYKAQLYDKNILENKRKNFYDDFLLHQ